MPQRSCSGCTACCFTHGVDALKKYPQQPCGNCLSGTGCRIYASRPSACAEFSCMWLSGDLRDDEKPNKTGVVVTSVQSGIAGFPQVLVLEAERLALHRPQTQDLISRLVFLGNIVRAHPIGECPRYHLDRRMTAAGAYLELGQNMVIWH